MGATREGSGYPARVDGAAGEEGPYKGAGRVHSLVSRSVFECTSVSISRTF